MQWLWFVSSGIPAVTFPNGHDQAFSTVNIEDSRTMKDLTFATLRDSAAMKLVSEKPVGRCFVILNAGC